MLVTQATPGGVAAKSRLASIASLVHSFVVMRCSGRERTYLSVLKIIFNLLYQDTILQKKHKYSSPHFLINGGHQALPRMHTFFGSQ